MRVTPTAGETYAERLRAKGALVTSYREGMAERIQKLAGGTRTQHTNEMLRTLTPWKITIRRHFSILIPRVTRATITTQAYAGYMALRGLTTLEVAGFTRRATLRSRRGALVGARTSILAAGSRGLSLNSVKRSVIPSLLREGDGTHGRRMRESQSLTDGIWGQALVQSELLARLPRCAVAHRLPSIESSVGELNRKTETSREDVDFHY